MRQRNRGREKVIKTAIQGGKSAHLCQLCPQKESRKEKEDLLETDASDADRETNKQTDRRIETRERRLFTLFQVFSSGPCLCSWFFLVASPKCLHPHTHTCTHAGELLTRRQSECCLAYSWALKRHIYCKSAGEEQSVSYRLSRVLLDQRNGLTINESWPCLPVSHSCWSWPITRWWKNINPCRWSEQHPGTQQGHFQNIFPSIEKVFIYMGQISKKHLCYLFQLMSHRSVAV